MATNRFDSHEAIDFFSRLEDIFSHIAYLSCLASQGVWYIDNGVSMHMTRVREYFSSYNEEMDFHITMGNMTKCTLVGRGTIDIKRESKASISVTDVLHVLE